MAPQYAGLYGIWLKKAAAGWRLVFTRQPDVWGTQYDPASVVAEASLQYEKTPQSSSALIARIDGDARTARLVMNWGPHQWTAGFSAAP